MSGKAVRETLGFLGVMASLVFVGLEIRQNTVVARAATRQAIADHLLVLSQGLYGDPELHDQLMAWNGAEEGSFPDCVAIRLCTFVRAMLRAHENVFLQVQEGLVDESAFLSYAYQNQAIYESPHLRAVWPGINDQLHPDFVAAFEAEYDLAP